MTTPTTAELLKYGGKNLGTGTGTWQSDDKTIVYTQTGTDLVISTRPGEDYVFTGAGSNHIQTGYGSDIISSGAGDDYIYSAGLAGINGFQNHDPADASGGDVVDAGAGNDQVRGSIGKDTLFGGSGDDGLMGMEGNDLLLGGDGDDALMGDALYSLDSKRLTSPDEILGYANGGDDTLFGGAGSDRLVGGVGKDYLDGGTGNDQLYGDTDSHFVEGNEQWIPGEFHGDDTLDGGDAICGDNSVALINGVVIVSTDEAINSIASCKDHTVATRRFNHAIQAANNASWRAAA